MVPMSGRAFFLVDLDLLNQKQKKRHALPIKICNWNVGSKTIDNQSWVWKLSTPKSTTINWNHPTTTTTTTTTNYQQPTTNNQQTTTTTTTNNHHNHHNHPSSTRGSKRWINFLSSQPLGRSARPNSTFEPQLIAVDSTCLTGVQYL